MASSGIGRRGHDLSATPQMVRSSVGEVKKYLAMWDSGANGRLDAALATLFRVMPHNTDVGEVGVKLAALNSLYSTNIFAVVQVARHIVDLGIDVRLADATVDPKLVEDIAKVTIRGKTRRNYSFATKYCSFHRPDLYPIYDSIVSEVLNGLLRQGETFDEFRPGERWRTDYGLWCRSITKFRSYYGLDEFSVRDIDKYLWMLGRERREAMQELKSSR